MQVAGVLIYTLISVAPLLIVLFLVGGDYSLKQNTKNGEKKINTSYNLLLDLG